MDKPPDAIEKWSKGRVEKKELNLSKKKGEASPRKGGATKRVVRGRRSKREGERSTNRALLPEKRKPINRGQVGNKKTQCYHRAQTSRQGKNFSSRRHGEPNHRGKKDGFSQGKQGEKKRCENGKTLTTRPTAIRKKKSERRKKKKALPEKTAKTSNARPHQ